MQNTELINIILLPKIKYALLEVKEIANLIKLLDASNRQEVIEYEDILNKYSNLDYNNDSYDDEESRGS